MLPSAGYETPPIVSADGLVVTPITEDGCQPVTFDFRDSPGSPRLKREMVAAFAKACSATGTLRRPRSWKTSASILRRFLAFTAEGSSPLLSVQQITPGVWAQWMLAQRADQMKDVSRRLLLLADGLPQATRTAIEVRRKRRLPAPSPSYTMAQFKRIRSAALRTVSETEVRIDAGTKLLRQWRAGEIAEGSGDWRVGWLLDELSTTGDLPRYPSGPFHHEVKRILRTLPEQFLSLLHMLYPSPTDLGAMAAALICEQGWNLSVLQEMNIPDQRPDGGVSDVAIHRTEVVKQRRPRSKRFASNNLVDLGPGTAGRVMAQVLAITDHARQSMAAQGLATRRLLVARRCSKNGHHEPVWSLGPSSSSVSDWSLTLNQSGHGLDVGTLSARTLRRSHQVLYGGTRQNSQRVHEDVYLLRDEHIRQETAPDAVAQGLRDAVDHASTTLRMRMLTPQRYSGHGTDRAGISASQFADIEAGRLDTATGACLDFEHSPFTPAGPCSASFLLCFGCPNAIAVPRHLPRIIYLHDALTSLRSAVSAAVWDTDWKQHNARICDLLHTNTSDAERGQLRDKVTDGDRRLVDNMLQRRLDA